MKRDVAPFLAPLRATDLDAIGRALELVRLDGDPALYDALLEGVALGHGGLTGGKHHRGGVETRPYREHVVRALVAMAPPGSQRAAALREKVTRLSISAATTDRVWRDPTARADLDLGPIAGLPRLEQLDLEHGRRLLHLDALAAHPALAQLSFQGCAELTSLGPLAGAQRLRRLSLRECPIEVLDVSGLLGLEEIDAWNLKELREVRGVDRLPSLRKLSLGWCPKLVAAPGLERAVALVELDLRATPELALPDLSALRAVRKATFAPRDQAALERVGGLAGLESLTLASEAVTDLAPLARLMALRELDVTGSRVADLAPLAGLRHLKKLVADRCPALSDVSGLAGLSALEHLGLSGCEKLLDLDGLRSSTGSGAAGGGAGLAALRAVELAFSGVTRLGGLAAAPNLEVVGARASAVASVEGLGGLSKLRVLDLERCARLTDLTPLAGATALVEVKVSGTKVTRTRVPEAIRPAVRPSSLVAASRPRVNTAPRPAAPKGPARGQLARLKKLVFTRDFDLVSQGVELARALGDPAVFDGLLDGTAYARAKIADLLPRTGRYRAQPEVLAPEYGRLVPNALFTYGPPLRPYREHALRALVAAAPEGSSAYAIRSGVESLLLTGELPSWKRTGVDLAACAGFPALRELAVYRCDRLTGLDALSAMPRLEALALLDCDELVDLDTVAGAPALRALRIGDAPSLRTLGTGAGLSRLRELAVVRSSAAEPELSALARMDAIESLTLEGLTLAPGALDAIATRPRLARLCLQSVKLPEGALGRLAAMPALRQLALPFCSGGGKIPEGLGALTHLDLSGWREIVPADLEAIAALPRLEKLSLRYVQLKRADLPERLRSITEL